MSFYTKIFGDPNEKLLKELFPIVEKINGFESAFSALSDEELREKTPEFRNRIAKDETLEDILPEAFAVVREASKRVTGMRHFDVQMIGGIILYRRQIAEMRTGEGKTLVATLPAYLVALEKKGVHIVTVNDYLAKRDAVWMGKIYDFLGMSVGIIQNLRVSFVYDAIAKRPTVYGPQSTDNSRQPAVADDSNLSTVDHSPEDESFKIENEFLRPASRQEAYQCDITYGTNNEFGFDYLRDNMAQDFSEMVMRRGSEMHYAIVDEVDSILIDEARTPLIISAPAEEATEQYYQFAALVKRLDEKDDYNVDEKLRSATLTESGIAKLESWLGIDNIYVEGGLRTVHHIEQALKAEVLFKRDKDYVVEESGDVVIVDEFTGRKMPGRRYSEGLHQAIEAKENVSIQRESRTLATITFQNLFRMYGALAGMTGTAATEAEEFEKIYHLEVVVIPTNRPDKRVDYHDRIYRTEAAKFRAVVKKIQECHEKGQPILVGTISVEKNEQLSAYLWAQGISHEILNAKNHEREGEIIARAGRPGAITLATNMAGRGVDIKLGGVLAHVEDTERVVGANGLFVLGTERHESRRIDNQLRGRSARQGDPGETQFFVSTDDDLMRIFAGERIKTVMTRMNVPEDMPIEQPMITKLLESAQKKVEGHNFDLRKHLLEYDDVLNRHRTALYAKRRNILKLGGEALSPSPVPAAAAGAREDVSPASLKDVILSMTEAEIEFVVSYHTQHEDRSAWNVQEVYETMRTIVPFSDAEKQTLLDMGNGTGETKLGLVEARDAMVRFLLEKARHAYAELEEHIGQSASDPDPRRRMMPMLERSMLIRAIDMLWVEHLDGVEYLRKGIGLRGYGQRDPLVEYKKEMYRLFNELETNIQKEVVYTFFKVNAGFSLAPTIMATDKLTLSGATKEASAQGEYREKKPRDEHGDKIGRNDPCYCGSGKKFKKCHGA